MIDERIHNIDQGSWAWESLIGQLKDWTPKARVRNVTATTNVNPLDGIIRADATSAAITLTLETAAGCDGRLHHIKKIDSSSNAITIDGNGSETIDGASTYTLSAQYDHVLLISNGTNWDILSKPATATTIGPFAQYRLQKTSASASIFLYPHMGNKLSFPDGTVAEIPSAGLSISASGASLSADTNYLLYATKSGSAVNAIEASTTVRAVDSDTGIPIKSGDNTRVCVGMARTTTGPPNPTFVNDIEFRYVRALNDKGINCQGDWVGSGTESAGTFKNVGAGEVYFLAWEGEIIQVSLTGYASNNTAGQGIVLGIGFDSTTTAQAPQPRGISNGANDQHPFCVTWTTTSGGDTNHFFTGMFKNNGGGTAKIDGCSLTVTTFGAP